MFPYESQNMRQEVDEVWEQVIALIFHFEYPNYTNVSVCYPFHEATTSYSLQAVFPFQCRYTIKATLLVNCKLWLRQSGH